MEPVLEPVMEAVTAATDGLLGGQALDVGKIPGVDQIISSVRGLASTSFDGVYDLLAPYASIEPLKVLLLLYLVKFLVTLPLSNIFKSEKDVCYNPDKICGNTFNTFYKITKVLISWMIFMYYVQIMSGGFVEYGFFSIAAFLPIATVTILVLLAIWFLKAVGLTKKNNPYFEVGGSVPYPFWRLVQSHISENMTVLATPVAGLPFTPHINGTIDLNAGGTSLFWVISVAAIFSLAVAGVRR